MNYEVDNEGKIWQQAPAREVSVAEVRQIIATRRNEVLSGDTQIEAIKARKPVLEAEIAELEALLPEEED